MLQFNKIYMPIKLIFLFKFVSGYFDLGQQCPFAKVLLTEAEIEIKPKSYFNKSEAFIA